MTTVRMTVTVAAACLLAACIHNMEISETGCERNTQTFPEMSGCLKKVVDEMYTPRPQYSAELNIYLAQERYLYERVDSKQINDFDARVALRKNYISLREHTAQK